jgi:phosphoribosylanthranilate isomerase
MQVIGADDIHRLLDFPNLIDSPLNAAASGGYPGESLAKAGGNPLSDAGRNGGMRFAFPPDATHIPGMTVTVKICGLSSEEGVAAAVAGGAAYVGFVFFGASPRAVSPARAAALCAAVPSGVQRVGLFVDADDDAIRVVLAAAPIDLLQFHGSESPDRVVDAKLRFHRPVIKAIAVAAPEDVLAAARYEADADMLLFDAKPPRRVDALPGGNGLAFDWHLIAGHAWRRPWMLSGGLTAALLPEAVHISGASVVDVSSGVERRPGDKDPDKIREFLAAARRL